MSTPSTPSFPTPSSSESLPPSPSTPSLTSSEPKPSSSTPSSTSSEPKPSSSTPSSTSSELKTSPKDKFEFKKDLIPSHVILSENIKIVDDQDGRGRGLTTKIDIKKGTKIVRYPSYIFYQEPVIEEKCIRDGIISMVYSSRGSDGKAYYSNPKNPTGGWLINDAASAELIYKLRGITNLTDLNKWILEYKQVKPNTYQKVVKGHLTAYASRDIKAGESIFASFGVNYWISNAHTSIVCNFDRKELVLSGDGTKGSLSGDGTKGSLSGDGTKGSLSGDGKELVLSGDGTKGSLDGTDLSVLEIGEAKSRQGSLDRDTLHSKWNKKYASKAIKSLTFMTFLAYFLITECHPVLCPLFDIPYLVKIVGDEIVILLAPSYNKGQPPMVTDETFDRWLMLAGFPKLKEDGYGGQEMYMKILRVVGYNL